MKLKIIKNCNNNNKSVGLMLSVDMIEVSVPVFLQIKVVRETMNHALETWRGVIEDAPALMKSECDSVSGKALFLHCAKLSSEVTFKP